MSTKSKKTTTEFNPDLLTGVEALTRPDYHALNKFSNRNDRLLHAVMCAYAKHVSDCEEIGWEQLSDILYHAIVNEIGDDAFVNWTFKLEKGD